MKWLNPALICLLALPPLGNSAFATDAETGVRVTRPVQSKLFRHQYTIYDRDFCGAQVCVDFDDDGQKEIMFASRATGNLQQLNAADGEVEWSRKFEGHQQSVTAYDLDDDDDFEILYSVSGPGRLHLLDHQGQLLKKWDSGDWKLGNSAVILDADGDGVLDGYFGSRSRYLVRFNLLDFTHTKKREGWVQCGCYTSAMDVDQDGRWDLFAGSGDDSAPSTKGVLHRYDPVTLETIWDFHTNDNASSADAVLVDIDNDGQVEIIKSVDNYNKDDAHDAVYAFETDGTLLWKVPGPSGEDSPNVADLDGDGDVEIVGMTFGGEVYCLNSKGEFDWRNDLRPKLDDGQHMYMCPILCDLDGDRELEILAMTNGQYSPTPGVKPNAKLFALSAHGEVLDEFDLGESRFWGHAFVCQIDEDPFLELVISGSGGLDVIETRGLGPYTEHFQRRRSYQRVNVVPWAYEDSYFLYRGRRNNVATVTDNLALSQTEAGYASDGTFVTEELTPPSGCAFDQITHVTRQPPGTQLRVSVVGASGDIILEHASSEQNLDIRVPVRLEFRFSTEDPMQTPKLDSYALSFDRIKS